MSASLSIGGFELTLVSGGRLWIDGGNMFGVIPRVLWQRKAPPDDQHRIPLNTNCILVRSRSSLGLIDTGYGSKASDRFRQRYSLETGEVLVRNLAASNVDPAEIDWVILTHLHFDHAGGLTFRDDAGNLLPTFPRARHYIQQAEWHDALSNLPELAGAYHADDFVPLEKAGLVELVEGDAEILPGVFLQCTGGHTRGHQIVRLESEKESAICPGDLCPTTAHLPTFWTMAYDQFPLAVRRVKPLILGDAAERQRIALFAHDPYVAAGRLARDADNEWRVTPLVTTS